MGDVPQDSSRNLEPGCLELRKEERFVLDKVGKILDVVNKAPGLSVGGCGSEVDTEVSEVTFLRVSLSKDR